jgi:ferritin-like protein
MASSSAGLHEPAEKLQAETIDQHRALVSIMEELEAVDWYHQRADATSDATLAAVLRHNRDEEKEHAAMALEWLRRTDPKFAQHLKTFLFTEGPITEIEAEVVHGQDGAEASGASEAGAGANDGSLAIGSLRKAGGDK